VTVAYQFIRMSGQTPRTKTAWDAWTAQYKENKTKILS